MQRTQAAGMASVEAALLEMFLDTHPRAVEFLRYTKKNERGETPLHVAARRGEHRQCKKLLNEGALVNAGDYAGWTPLHEACSHAHFKVAKILIDGGANVNACSESLDTPLHDASSNGCEKLVWLLLHAGADRERVNSAGKRPIDLCPPERSSVYALLTSSSVPERCPSEGESPALQPLAANQLESANASHALSVSTTSPGDGSALKQPTPSPAETDITVHSETCLKGEGREFAHHPDANNSVQAVKIPEQRADLNTGSSLVSQEQGCVIDDGAVASSDERHEVKASADETSSSDKFLPSKEPSPPVTRRSVWREERDTSVKADEQTTGTQACSFEEDQSRDASHQEGDVALEQESRRGGRTRGAPRKFSSQPPPQISQKPPAVPERRKQRGRRRGRGGAASSGVVHPPHQATPVDDVYEFRSSPESDINVNKTVGEPGREMSAPPAAKRQRVTQPTPSPAPPETVEDEQREEQEESNDVGGGGVNESNDDKTDDVSDRKVPPLRISLPRTPSEEGAVVTGTDETSTTATNTGRRKGPKGHIKKQSSPDEGIPVEESGQRVTRSKVRQSGRQLREHPGSSCEGSTKRKGGQNGWRQRSVAASATNASSIAPSVVANDEQETITETEQPPLPPPNEEVEMVSEGTNTPEEEVSPSPMSLMQRNSYEGFRGLRSLIEQRWIKATSHENEPTKPSPPANYDQYMIVQKNYTPGNVDPCSSLKDAEGDQELTAELTTKLHELRATQSERRHHMEVSHKIERERLQMLAEREVLRNLTRRANQDKDELSAIRIIHESDIYNTWYMEGEREPRSVMEDDELKMKFERLGILTENRHKLESDALFAEQVFTWNAMIQKSGNPALCRFKNKVPRVPVVQIRFNL